MKKFTSVLLVENNLGSYRQLEEKILQTGFCRQIRPALNGGHAYLFLEQMHWSGKIQETNLFIFLNLNTPIVNGIEFLEKFKAMNSEYKENIKIFIISDEASCDQLEKAKSLGFENFINKSSLEYSHLFARKNKNNKAKQLVN
ncbi:MAG: hypothetical protein ACK40G_02010 [Cytophagaceae bacterium]